MRSLVKYSLASAALIAGITSALVAGATLSKAGTAHVNFVAVGPFGMKINGHTSDLNVHDGGKTLTIEVPLSNLKTGIALRDRHMREKYLQVDKYPTARLDVARSALHFPAPGGSVNASATGKLTLHGQSHGVTFRYRAKNSGGAYEVGGSLHLDVRDYGIHIPSYLGVTVKPGIDVSTTFSLRDN